MIAVVGATGNTGRAVVNELKRLGHNPVCIVRNADKAREVLGPNAKAAVAELTDRAALEKALAGVTSIFVVTGHNPQMAEQQNSVLDAALKAGAKYLVRVSGGRAVVGPDARSVVGRGHHAIEERLRGSGIGWVIDTFQPNSLPFTRPSKICAVWPSADCVPSSLPPPTFTTSVEARSPIGVSMVRFQVPSTAMLLPSWPRPL